MQGGLRGSRMVLVVLLGLGWLCTPLGALAMDFNVKIHAGVQGDQKGSHCVFDDDCGTRKFCIKPRNEKPFCATCRRIRRRCQHATMCCPGMLCVNNVCTLGEDAPRGQERDKRRRKTNIETPPPLRKVQKKQQCLRKSDCERGFCCAHHFRTKVCKPMLQEGHVCSARRHSFEPTQNMFQRCNCKAGLVCRNQVARHRGRLQVCQKA